MAQFEKEKSPFLAVKSLLKPIKKSRLSEAPDPVPDWRQLAGEQIRARQGRAGLQHKVPSWCQVDIIDGVGGHTHSVDMRLSVVITQHADHTLLVPSVCDY